MVSGRRTQSALILELLGDGRWHSSAEILGAVPCIVHSRVAELRKKGHRIEHETRGTGATGSVYRLVGSVTLAEPGTSVRLGPDEIPGSASVAASDLGGAPQSPPPAAPRSVREVVELLRSHGLFEVGSDGGERLFDLEDVAA